MNHLSLPFSRVALLSALPLLLMSASASAKPKVVPTGGPSACGYRSIPLATGNSWTYRTGSTALVVKIANVGPGKDWSGKPATVIDVEETYNGRVVKTQWSCTTAGGLILPVDDFFWSGEPGGAVGETFTVKTHEKPWLIPEAELVGDVAWIEIITADVVRPDGSGAGAVHRPATLEVERHAQLKGTDNVVTTLGQFSAERVVFELRGKATLVGDLPVAPTTDANDPRTAVVPIKRPATVWYTKGLGVVKLDDAFDKTWELTETSLLPPTPPK